MNAQHNRPLRFALTSGLANPFDSPRDLRFFAVEAPKPRAPWISVDVELPEPSVEVLVAFVGLSLPSTGQYTGSPHDHHGWCYPAENNGTAEDGGDPVVSHWMPLPAVPGSVTSEQPSSPLGGKYSNVLAPFVALMDLELHANADKGDRPGWLTMTPDVAMLEIYYHVAKLQKAVRGGDISSIREHAADVANMAMMALDVCGGLEGVPR